MPKDTRTQNVFQDYLRDEFGGPAICDAKLANRIIDGVSRAIRRAVIEDGKTVKIPNVGKFKPKKARVFKRVRKGYTPYSAETVEQSCGGYATFAFEVSRTMLDRLRDKKKEEAGTGGFIELPTRETDDEL